MIAATVSTKTARLVAICSALLATIAIHTLFCAQELQLGIYYTTDPRNEQCTKALAVVLVVLTLRGCRLARRDPTHVLLYSVGLLLGCAVSILLVLGVFYFRPVTVPQAFFGTLFLMSLFGYLTARYFR